jgi:tRNA(adenine34) deaminase
VQIGAVLVDNQGTIVSACRNAVEGLHDATCHAEIECLRAASKKLKNWRLENCTLYTTLEPCDMCMGAIMAFRVPRLVYGLNDSKIGFFRNHEYPVTSHKNAFHSIDIQGGVLGNDSKVMLKAFFQARRKTGLDSVASDDEKLLGRNLEIEK